jgi:hypothetical protein
VAAPHSGTSAYAISNHAYGRVKSDLVTGISPGEPYDVALWLRGELDTCDSQQGVKVRVHFLDASNAQISVADVYNELSSLPTDWTKVEGQVTPPAGTAKIQVSLWFYMASGWVAFDDVYLGHFKEQVNLLTEPGFESASGWTPVTIAGWPGTSLWRGNWGPGIAHTGSFSYVISNQALGLLHSQRFAVTAGESYDASVDIRGGIDLDDSVYGALVRMRFFDDPAGGNLVGEENVYNNQVGTLTETWQRVGSTIEAPAGAVSAEMTLWLVHASGWVAFDEVQVSPTGTSTNLVTNPGFEAATGWTVERLNPSTSFWRGTWGTGVPSAGSYAYVISNHVYAKLQSDPVTVDPSTEYDLSAWVRGELDPDDGLLGVKVRVAYYRADDSLIRSQDIYDDWGVALSETWAQVGGRFTTPSAYEQCDHLRVELWSFQASGWVAFDDVELTRAPPTVQFSQADYTVGEADGQVELTVTLSHAPEDPVTVSYSTHDGTTIEGQDYTATSGVLTWAPNDATPRTITIPILGDELVEGDEDLDAILQITQHPNGAELGTPSQTQITIADDDQPRVAFATSLVAGNENQASVEFQVSLSQFPVEPVEVRVTTADDSAEGGEDYTATTVVVSWSPGDPLTKTVTIELFDDENLEGSETFFVNLTDASGLQLPDTPAATAIIRDDEAADLDGWRAEAQAPWYVGHLGSGFARVPFRQEYSYPDDPLKVPLVFATLWDGADGQPANVRIRNVSGTQFDAAVVEPTTGWSSGQLWFGYIAIDPGVHVLPDGTILEAGTIDTSLLQPGTDWAMIHFDAQFQSTPVVLTQIQTATNLEGSDPDLPTWMTTAVGSVSLTGAEVALERSHQTIGNVGSPETIAYLAISGSGVIPSPQNPYGVAFDAVSSGQILGDKCEDSLAFGGSKSLFALAALTSRQDPEGGWVRFCSTSAGRSVLVEESLAGSTHAFVESVSTVILEKSFDTVIPLPTIRIESLEPTTLTEGDPGDPPNAFTLTLSLSKQWAEPVSVVLAVSNPPETTPATPGEDFTLPEITIPPFTEGLVDFTIGIVPDALFEGDEAFTITIESATNTTIDDTSGSVTATIVGDEPLPVATISAGQGTEGIGATIEVTGTLSVAVQGGVTVTLTPVAIAGDPEAVADEDFFDTPPITLTWADGATASTTAFVTLVNDNVSELSERFTFILDSASPSAVTVPLDGVYATITDDDPQPVVAFSTLITSVVEGSAAPNNRTIDLQVSLAGHHERTVEVGVSLEGYPPGTTATDDFSFSPTTLTWQEDAEGAQSISLTIVGDTIDEDDQTIGFVLSLTGGLAEVSAEIATVTIQDDDDPPTVSIAAPSSSNIDELGSGSSSPVTFVVNVAGLTEKTITVPVTVDGSASSPTLDNGDYTMAGDDVIITPPAISGEKQVNVLGDDEPEPDETLVLQLVNPTNATVDVGSASITILDDEPAPVATVTAGEGTEGVGATIEVTGTLSVAVQGGASVTLTPVEIVGDPEAVADEDFFDTPPITLTWADGATASTTTFVTLVNDDVSEATERFTFILDSASPSAVTVPLNGVYATITDDDPQPVVAFSVLTPPPVQEGTSALGGSVTLDVSLTNDHAGPITVGIAPDVDDPGTAQASDFSLAPASLTWESRDIGPKQVIVTIAGDEIVENDSTIRLALSLISGLAEVSSDVATITIEDDDVAGIEITPSQPPLETDEGGASVDVAFRLTAKPTSDVTIHCSSSNPDEGRVRAPSELTFTTDNWSVERSITVTGQDDEIPDHDQPYSVDVTIETTAPGYEHLVVEPIAFINLDDEAQPEVKFTQSTVMVLEGAQLDVEVRVNPMPVEAFSVHWQIIDGTGDDGAHAGSDYQPSDAGPLSGDLSYADGVWTGQIPAIDILPDGTVDLDQEFTITLSSPTAAVSLGEPSTLTVTIHDPAVPAAIIGEPTGRFYGYQSETLTMDGTSSVVPEDFEKKFVVLRNRWGDLEDPLWLENDTNGLLFDTFQTDHDMQYYLVRLVIATGDAMPTDDQMLWVANPCVDTSEFECSEAEVKVLPPPEGAITPFLTGYVMPEAVLLTWRPLDTVIELERSDDAGETWEAIYRGWDFNGDGVAGTGFVDRAVTQGNSYHFRIREAQDPPEPEDPPLDPLPWVYLGNSLLSPGDSVLTPVWAAPRPVPTFESVEWSCPEEASRFLCPGTVKIRLDPEPGESLEGTSIRVFVNEDTSEAKDGVGRDVEYIVPEVFPFKGRDEPACVVNEGAPYFEEDLLGHDDGMEISISPVDYGTNTFRFEVRGANGEYAERGLLYGIYESVGTYSASPATFQPLLFGDRYYWTNFRLRGLGSSSRRSPDCVDGDSPHVVGLDGLYEVTDSDGRWEQVLLTADQTERNFGVGNFDCDSTYVWHFGRSILDPDGEQITDLETAREVCGGDGWRYSYFTDTTLPLSHPPHLQDPQELAISTGSEETEMVLYRFVVWDDGQDVVVQDPRRMSLEEITSVIVVNNSLVPPEKFYAWYGNSALQAELGPGAFVVETPMLLPSGSTSHPTELQIHAVDRQGNELIEDVTVLRQPNQVRAEIGSVSPSSALPNQLVTFDASGSIVPSLGLPGGSVAKWVFFSRGPTYPYWSVVATSDFLAGPEGLTIGWTMPPEKMLKARLVVAKDLASFPTAESLEDRSTIPCRWWRTGSCDTAEVVVEMSDADCYAPPHYLGVSVNDPPLGSQISIAPTGDVVLDTAVNQPNTSFTYRWVVYDSDGAVVTYLRNPGEGVWSENNHHVEVAPGLPVGSYTVRAEAMWPPLGCTDPDVEGWWFGTSRSIHLIVHHVVDGVAPGTVTQGHTIRVYSSTLEAAVGAGALVVALVSPVDGGEGWEYYDLPLHPGGFVEFDLIDGSEEPLPAGSYHVQIGEDSETAWLSNEVDITVVESGVGLPVPVNTGDGIYLCSNTDKIYSITPGQTIRGHWDDGGTECTGDTDYLSFIAGAGTDLTATLDRDPLETTAPLDPASTAPELLVIRPDGIVFAVAAPPSLESTTAAITDLELPLSGRYILAARTARSSGDFILHAEVAETVNPSGMSLGYNNERMNLVVPGAPFGATLRRPMLDPFGAPVSGAPVSWQAGTWAGGVFTPSGEAPEVMTTGVDGWAKLAKAPPTGSGVSSWLPSLPLEAAKVATSVPVATTPVLGYVAVGGDEVTPTRLPTIVAARALEEVFRQSQALGRPSNKTQQTCTVDSLTCSDDIVFHVAQLDLVGASFSNLELKFRDAAHPDDSNPLRALEGETFKTRDLWPGLWVSATANGGTPLVGLPIAVTAVGDFEARIITSGVCDRAEVDSGEGAASAEQFDYKAGHSAAYNGAVGAWATQELLVATVRVTTSTGAAVTITKSLPVQPRAEEPCEIRPYPPEDPDAVPPGEFQVAGVGPVTHGGTDLSQLIGSVYLTDACNNITLPSAGGPQLQLQSLTSDPDQGSTVSASLIHSDPELKWGVLLTSTNTVGTSTFVIPDVHYTASLGFDSPSSCGGTQTYDLRVNYNSSFPEIQLKWARGGTEPDAPLASPGSALRDPTTGELMVWRVRPAESGAPSPGGQHYENIPVRVYVADSFIYFDEDGNVAESYRKVEGAELCVGVAHMYYDPATNHYERTATCDPPTNQQVPGEVTILAKTEDDWSATVEPEVFDDDIGITVGVTKVPDEAGTYYLVAEPLPAAEGEPDFRRGNAWRIDTDFSIDGIYHRGTYRKRFEVGGGMFLDEDWRPLEKDALVNDTRTVYLRLTATNLFDLGGGIDVVTRNDDEVMVDRVQDLSVQAIGTSGTYVSGPIHIRPPWVLPGKVRQDVPELVIFDPVGTLEAISNGATLAMNFLLTRNPYEVVVGRRNQLAVASFESPLGVFHYICSFDHGTCPCPANDPDCAFQVAPAEITWSIEPASADDSVARLERETDGDYLRAIRKSEGRTLDGALTVRAGFDSGAVPTSAKASITTTRPTHLGCCAAGTCQKDGVTFECLTTFAGGTLDLEERVIDIADQHGMPPQLLMAQIVQEAGIVAGQPNAYAFRYELDLDFESWTGDADSVVSDGQRHLFHAGKAGRNLGVGNGAGEAEYVPCDIAGIPCSSDDQPNTLFEPVQIVPVSGGATPGTVWRVVTDTDPAEPIDDLYLEVGITDWNDPNNPNHLVEKYPGQGEPSGPYEFKVNGREGTVTFGAPWTNTTKLSVYARRAIVNTRATNTVPSWGISVPTLATIIANNPPSNVLPPLALHETIADWAIAQTSNPIAGNQDTSRYGFTFAGDAYWGLVKIDNLFRIQGQWYIAASYGLLQQIPESTRVSISRQPDPQEATLLAVYDPRSDSPDVLFDPDVAILFGALFVSDAAVTPESDPLAGEPACLGSPTDCSWVRLWRRRLRTYNTGLERVDPGNDYDDRVFNFATQMSPSP